MLLINKRTHFFSLLGNFFLIIFPLHPHLSSGLLVLCTSAQYFISELDSLNASEFSVMCFLYQRTSLLGGLSTYHPANFYYFNLRRTSAVMFTVSLSCRSCESLWRGMWLIFRFGMLVKLVVVVDVYSGASKWP